MCGLMSLCMIVRMCTVAKYSVQRERVQKLILALYVNLVGSAAISK